MWLSLSVDDAQTEHQSHPPQKYQPRLHWPLRSCFLNLAAISWVTQCQSHDLHACGCSLHNTSIKNSSTSFKNINGYLTCPFVQKKHAEGNEKWKTVVKILFQNGLSLSMVKYHLLINSLNMSKPFLTKKKKKTGISTTPLCNIRHRCTKYCRPSHMNRLTVWVGDPIVPTVQYFQIMYVSLKSCQTSTTLLHK